MDKVWLVTAYSDYCVFCRLTATFVFCRLAAMCQRTPVAWFTVLYSKARICENMNIYQIVCFMLYAIPC